LTCVCRFADFLIHALCLAKVQDSGECDRKFKKFQELDAKIKEENMEPTNHLFPENYGERLALCW
jgi:hypothetical protein